MRICITLPTVQEIGTRFVELDHRYSKDWHLDRRFHTPIKAIRPQTFTLLDHDFQIARRAKGVGYLAHYLLQTAVMGPLDLVYVGGEKIGQGLNWLGDRWARLSAAHGVPHAWGIRRTYRNIFREIAAK